VLKREMKPTQIHMIYLTKEQHLQGRGSIDWLRIRRPETGSASIGCSTSLESCQSETG
jgi:hypothetical protein